MIDGLCAREFHPLTISDVTGCVIHGGVDPLANPTPSAIIDALHLPIMLLQKLLATLLKEPIGFLPR